MEGGLSFLSNCHIPSFLSLPSISISNSNSNSNSNSKPCLSRIIKSAVTEEIRVCANKTCRRQGSMQTLDILSNIAPPDVSVKSCGCLGRCGAGPNLVFLPDGVLVAHCGTAARAAEVMIAFCGGTGSNDDASRTLDALALRKKADDEFHKGNPSTALLLLSQAIDLKPCGGLHTIFKDRASMKLAMGDYSGALEDAKEALTLAPKYPEAYICEGDAFLAMDQVDAAENSYSISLEIDPSLRRSKSFKARISKLQEKLIAANMD